MERSKVRVFVVDDFEPWRRFVISAIRNSPRLVFVGEAGDGLKAIEKATELKPDLVVLDIAMPSMNGIEAAGRILELLPNTKILFLSENRSMEIVEHVLREGACGYVVKSSAATELTPAIETVLQGGQFISECLAEEGGADLIQPAGPGGLATKSTRM